MLVNKSINLGMKQFNSDKERWNLYICIEHIFLYI